MKSAFDPFLSGIITAGFMVASLFFLRFWSRSRESLFLAFGAAFVLLALNQALLVFANVPEQAQPSLYLLRFLAFLIIAIAIFYKNKQGERR